MMIVACLIIKGGGVIRDLFESLFPKGQCLFPKICGSQCFSADTQDIRIGILLQQTSCNGFERLFFSVFTDVVLLFDQSQMDTLQILIGMIDLIGG